jgi:hypothetical protein
MAGERRHELKRTLVAVLNAPWQEKGYGMYATVMQCDLGAYSSVAACERAARDLATALAALPGFVAFVAIETDSAAGVVTAVYLDEEHAGLAAAERVIAHWHGQEGAMDGGGFKCLGAGEVTAQRGL